METYKRGASFTSGNFAVEETYTNWGSIELKESVQERSRTRTEQKKL